MSLKLLFSELAELYSGSRPIEVYASEALRNAEVEDVTFGETGPLASPFLEIFAREDAHPICRLIAGQPFSWAPPQTSQDPLYIQHSKPKAHVELLGPGGLIKSDEVRLGLYGMMPNAEYGNRTHPAEETYIMLAGGSYWSRDNKPYSLHLPGDRSHHPSMMPHASMTKGTAFMSVYVWYGDISVSNYVYEGIHHR